MKLAIDPETTVGALLDAYPQAEEVLVDLAPAFAKLRNPVVRRTVAKVATLEQAAKIGGVSLQAMILKLRDVTGEGGAPLAADGPQNDASETPSWVADGRLVEEIDAGAMLARGVHPIGKIREAVGALRPGEVVLLRSSFRPEPLIETMRRAGAAVHSLADGPTHLTYFARPASPTFPCST